MKITSSEDYKLEIVTQRTLKLWWIIPIFMLIGSLTGYLASFFIEPVYEATFMVTTNMRISMTEEITEIMLDAAINHVGDLVFHPDVVDELISVEATQDNPLTLEVLKKITSVERRLMSTLIKVKWTDPQVAARIANTWGIIFYEKLNDAYEQSLIANSLSAYQAELETCLSNTTESECGSYCGLEKDELVAEITYTTAQIAAAKSDSLGLSSDLNISQYQEAEVPTQPLRYSRGALILAGSGLGFITALIILETRPQKREQ